MPSSCDSLLRLLYVYAFCFDLVFAYPIYAVLFERRGLGVMDISLLLTWWAVSAALFETPSGALADHWSRRKMLILAPLIKCVCFVIWRFAGGSFWLFALGFTFWGLGSSFFSGTLEAMLYDALKQSGRNGDYEKACGRVRLCKHAACGIACIAGGYIAEWSMSAALVLSVMPLALAAVVALAMVEPPHDRPACAEGYLSHFGNAWTEFRGSHALRYVLLYQVLTVGIMGEVDEYDALYFTAVGVPIQYLGWISILRGALEATGSMIAYRLKRLAFVEVAAPLIAGALLLCAGALPCKAMIAAILLSYLIIAPVEVLIEARMQDALRTTSRATALSSANLVGLVAALPPMVLFGLVSQRWGLGAGYMLFGITIACAGLWALRRRGR